MNPFKLREHPFNQKVYGNHPDPDDERDLIASIKANGVLEPLTITSDNYIISGHRRCQVAKLLQLDDVPVRVVTFKDDLHLESAIIEHNRSRRKTPEQVAREGRELKRIEKELAAQRQARNLKQNKAKQENVDNTVPVNSPERSTIGDARDIAAKKLGVSGQTLDRMERIIDRADELRDTGHEEEAAEIIETLNTKSVAKAYEKVVPPKPKPAQPDICDTPDADDKDAVLLDRLQRKWRMNMADDWRSASKEVKEKFLCFIGK